MGNPIWRKPPNRSGCACSNQRAASICGSPPAPIAPSKSRSRNGGSQGANEFDNAHAIRRLVDDVLYSHGLRMRGAPPSPEQKPIVTADDVRNARS
jgi:hypothetical protein